MGRDCGALAARMGLRVSCHRDHGGSGSCWGHLEARTCGRWPIAYRAVAISTKSTFRQHFGNTISPQSPEAICFSTALVSRTFLGDKQSTAVRGAPCARS